VTFSGLSVAARAHIGNPARGAIGLFTAACVIASFTVFTRAVSPMFGATAQTLVRFALAAVMLAGVNLHRRARFRLGRRDALRLVPLGALSAVLGVCLATAVAAAHVAVVMALLYGSSIVTAVLAGRLVLGEALTGARVIAIAIAVAGLGLYAHDGTGSPVGIVAAVVGGVCDGLCNSLRKQLRPVDRQVAVMWQYGIGALLASPVLLICGQPLFTAPAAGAVVAMVGYAAASAALGSLLLYGFGRLDVSAGTVILASQIVVAALLGLLLLHESPDSHELAGSAFIIVAATLSAAEPQRRWSESTGVHRELPSDTQSTSLGAKIFPVPPAR
jgi:drug/metabolite transporter (DMT)-like permease